MDLQKLGQALGSYIKPATFPVAIKMASSESELPEKSRMPQRDMGIEMPVCQGIALARRYGWTMAMSKDDMLCPPGGIALGFLPLKDDFLDGKFKVPPFLSSPEIRTKVIKQIPRFELGEYNYFVVAPVDRATFQPQSIVVYGNPAQIARLIQASVYGTGEPVMTPSLGGFACAVEITRPIQTDQCQVIIAGGGDRAIAQTQDSEMAFAMPASKVDSIIEGLEETHKLGQRYPTPSFLTYKAGFPPAFMDLLKYLRE